MRKDEKESFDVMDYSYSLPSELIAAHPARKRGSARLLELDRRTGRMRDSLFSDIGSFLKAGDHLVLNDTKVLRARFDFKRRSGASVELFLLRPSGEITQSYDISRDAWDVLISPSSRIKIGESLEDGTHSARVVRKKNEGIFEVVLSCAENSGHFDVRSMIESKGVVPLPPYIVKRRKDLKEDICVAEDQARYQTVYAQEEGSVAAPTAGLHFDDEQLKRLDRIGVERSFVTMHVGLGTFRPIKAEDIRQHVMEREWYEVEGETFEKLASAKAQGRRVVAVGTTTVRVLETVFKDDRRSLKGWSDLYIRPGFKFRCVDAMITNFHLPQSTLLLLVSAFAGREKVLNAYRHAVDGSYRFYSYGDAMFIY